MIASHSASSATENIISVAVDLVVVQDRFRKDFGDIDALAASIEELGLLQPIGIDSAYRLVFGERRLRAVKQLGLDKIKARFVNLDSLLKGELAENEFRKDFTPSERVAIGEAIEREFAQRHGGDRKTEDQAGKFSGLNEPTGDTRDLVAKATGFGNGKTYEQAKKVVQHAVPELVQAMDSGKASISAAALVAELPEPEQRAAVEAGRVKEVAKAARHVGKPKTGPKADAIREELKAAQERGVSMLCTYARLLIGAINAADSFTQEERELLAEVEGAILTTKAICNED
ncbi:ParB/RepB/Spo0J family partition protein [Comamonas odontotermitis]|uniref:ParB/RepB/Spo0J family partition protein n=1 Tax=Comamonas odontotermitis TaxID=379895 RepID=UPI001CC54F9B|nr:ParB/RepB/Spo0J family partition protein [Comamonas odontotermitis]UBB15451.1 ParB/RepB/Spo0J family partition protein [Comamonas odontotermitis]